MTMNQEINDQIPEYRQSKNAPSQNAIKDAYRKGVQDAYDVMMDQIKYAIEEPNFDVLYYTGINAIKNRLRQVFQGNINHHQGDE